MKIVCPSCQAQYEVPEVVLTSRRKMRCARCGGEWVPADMGAPAAAAIAEREAEPARAEPTANLYQLPPAPARGADSVDAPPAFADEPGHETVLGLAQGDELATMAAPELSWADQRVDAAPEHSVAREPAEPPSAEPPPRSVVLRAETPVRARTRLPDPAAIVVPPAVKGPPVLAWAASITLVVVLVAAAVIYRAPIMKVWPPSTRLYAGLGLV